MITQIDEIKKRLATVDANLVPIYGEAECSLEGHAEEDIRYLLAELDAAKRWSRLWKRTAKKERDVKHFCIEGHGNLCKEVVRQRHTIGRLVDILHTLNIEAVHAVLNCVYGEAGEGFEEHFERMFPDKITARLNSLGLSWDDAIEEATE